MTSSGWSRDQWEWKNWWEASAVSSGVSQPTATSVTLHDPMSILQAAHPRPGKPGANEALKFCCEESSSSASAHGKSAREQSEASSEDVVIKSFFKGPLVTAPRIHLESESQRLDILEKLGKALQLSWLRLQIVCFENQYVCHVSPTGTCTEYAMQAWNSAPESKKGNDMVTLSDAMETLYGDRDLHEVEFCWINNHDVKAVFSDIFPSDLEVMPFRDAKEHVGRWIASERDTNSVIMLTLGRKLVRWNGFGKRWDHHKELCNDFERLHEKGLHGAYNLPLLPSPGRRRLREEADSVESHKKKARPE